jgi:hypothetical protein
MHQTSAALEEVTMTKKFVFIAFSVGLAGALVAVAPSPFAPSTTMAAASQGIDAAEIGRSASTTLISFDDTYQRHMGVLDVLKAP